MDAHFRIRTALQGVLDSLTQWVGRILAASLWGFAGFLLVLFTCFFLCRDTAPLLKNMRALIPLSPRETEEIFRRVSDTIYATLYGTVLVAAVQGLLGGAIFWVLDPSGIVLGPVVLAITDALFEIWRRRVFMPRPHHGEAASDA